MIVVVPKKNGKLGICVDYHWRNAATISDPFPLLFTDTILDTVAGHEIFSFMDSSSGYNQVRMAEKDQEKTAFVTKWGVFVAVVMNVRIEECASHFSKDGTGNRRNSY